MSEYVLKFCGSLCRVSNNFFFKALQEKNTIESLNINWDSLIRSRMKVKKPKSIDETVHFQRQLFCLKTRKSVVLTMTVNLFKLKIIVLSSLSELRSMTCHLPVKLLLLKLLCHCNIRIGETSLPTTNCPIKPFDINKPGWLSTIGQG